MDVIKVAEQAQDVLDNENIPLQVAVMGCVVNGPGEARSADLGIAAGKNKGHLFIKGEVVRVVNENEMVDALLSEARLIVEQGIDARLAAAPVRLLSQPDALVSAVCLGRGFLGGPYLALLHRCRISVQPGRQHLPNWGRTLHWLA